MTHFLLAIAVVGAAVVVAVEALGHEQGRIQCNVASYIQVDGTFFDAGGRIIETALTNETNVPVGSRVPFRIGFQANKQRGRIELVVADVSC
jgi:hypothetical protein